MEPVCAARATGIQKACIICRSSEEIPSKLRIFQVNTWNSIKKNADLRRKLRSDIFHEVTIQIINKDEFTLSDCYHSPCLRKYSAVKRSTPDSQQTAPESSTPETRTRSSLPVTDEKGILSDDCIFCGKRKKKWNKSMELLSECNTKEGCRSILEAAQKKNDHRLISIFMSGGDLTARRGKYHKSCRRAYLKASEILPRTEQNSVRHIHAETLRIICDYVQHQVIDKKEVILSTSLFDLYTTEFRSRGGSQEDIDRYTVYSLMCKIKEAYSNEICTLLLNRRVGNLIHSSSMSESDARAAFADEHQSFKQYDQVRAVAMYLRSVILSMPKSKSPSPTSVHTLKETSPMLPEPLEFFFRTLYCGLLTDTDLPKENIERRVMSSASDAVFITSRGRVRPWKSTCLGLGMGTLTGSKTVVQMLNRLGHSISYDEVKALETEFAFTVSDNNQETPDGILCKPNLATATAWDNYDVNIETLDGKSTLHSTVGICYQNKSSKDDTKEIEMICRRKRRRYEGSDRDIPPFRATLKSAHFDISASPDDGQYVFEENLLGFYWNWQSLHRQLPLFHGFYSQFVTDDLPQQSVCYMDPIPLPPTRNDVVRDTMIRSLNVAKEVNQSYAIVSYDLAVAIKAYSIQAIESPEFDRLLILLGNFHLEMAFFGALGTYIHDSGIEYMLTESGILAEGSLTGFIKGKFYNRCVRIHQILASVMERLLFQRFLCTLSEEARTDMSYLLQDAPFEAKPIEEYLAVNDSFHGHLKSYNIFFKQVMDGQLGPTAAYWSTYVYMVNRVYRQLQQAMHTNDVDLYVSVLPTVLDIFFGLNRPNYARWGCLFLQKLQSLQPECRELLDLGAFSIRRTTKNYARTAVDMCLEQTVNKNAASPLKGIVAFRNSESTFRRWSITTTQRGLAVSELRTILGIEEVVQPSVQLRQWRVKKDNDSIDVLSALLKETCNPFGDPACSSPDLLNISSGKATDQETKLYLLGSLSRGREWRLTFQQECSVDKTRFLKTIPRIRVKNFAMENNNKRKSMVATLKSAAEGVRDVFARIIQVASHQTTTLDLRHILSFPVTEVPLSLAHSDGSPLKTEKSALLRLLEKHLDSSLSTASHHNVAATIIDGGLLFHTILQQTIGSYGAIARELLIKICSFPGNQIHVLFDKYINPSLKDNERKLRGADNITRFTITGPEQIPRQRGSQLLTNGNFKDELAKFLLVEWCKDHYGPIIGRKVLVVSHGGYCLKYSFNSEQEYMITDQPENLQGHHEEADTLVALHVSKVHGNIIVRASDTDIVVILLGLLGKMSEEEQETRSILLDCGYGNNRRYININELFHVLELKRAGISAALPAFHAFTGSDVTAAFYRKGKIRPFNVMANDETGKFVKAFQELSSTQDPDIETLSSFVCALYGHPHLSDLTEARYVMFNKMTGSVNQRNPLANVKRINCALLPPCTATLKKKIQRAQYLSILWHRADKQNPSDGLDPTQFGWKKDEKAFIPEWFEGSSVPMVLIQNTTNVAETVTCSDDIDHDESDDQWTDDESASDEDTY